MALRLHRATVLDLKGYTPFPGHPCLISSRSYNVRGILLELAHMLGEMRFLEPVCKEFLDGLFAINRSGSWIKVTPVLRVERGYGGGIAVEHCIVKLFDKRKKCVA